MTQNPEQSAYAPVRMRVHYFWQWARMAAQEHRILADGRIDSNLYRDLRQSLIDPFIAKSQAAAATDATANNALMGLVVKYLSYNDWVPLAAQYELNGRQIFDVHDHLTELLLHTDLGECTLEDLHLPYEAFYVHYGKQASIKLPFDAGFEYIDGAFVAEAPWDDACKTRRLKFGFSTVHEDGSGVMYPGYFFDLLPEELKLPVPDAVEAALQRRLKAYESTDETPPGKRVLNDSMQFEISESVSMLRQAAALLINSLFYLESIRSEMPEAEPGRDTPPDRHARWLQSTPEKRQRQRSALNSDGYALVRLVGREVDAEGATGGHGAGALRVHWRRGHWRFQRHGPQLSLRKRIWIKPVLVGSEHDSAPLSQLPGHRYVVPSNTAH